MLPRVDLPEVLLEVFSWTGADQAFTSVTGAGPRLKDLHVTIAALLVAHGCNVGYTPVIGGADALKYGRLSHVGQTYLRLATYRIMLGRYSFQLPDLPGGLRSLRDKHAAADEEQMPTRGDRAESRTGPYAVTPIHGLRVRPLPCEQPCLL
jgi:hypothetical protein